MSHGRFFGGGGYKGGAISKKWIVATRPLHLRGERWLVNEDGKGVGLESSPEALGGQDGEELFKKLRRHRENCFDGTNVKALRVLY